jgi:hypothetical protein
MKAKIEKTETDWMQDYGVYAVNRDSRLFENSSEVSGYTIELYWGCDENEVANRLAEVIDEFGDYDYCLYSQMHELVGFVYRTE